MDEQFFIQFFSEGIDEKWILGAFSLSIIFAFLNLLLARRNGRNPVLWGLMGLFFNIFSLIALFILGVSEEKKYLTDEKWRKRRERASKGIALNVEENLQESEVCEVVLETKKDFLWYYLDAANKRYGPMPIEELLKAWGSDLTESSYVWNEEMKDWQRIKNLPDLKNELEKRVSEA